MTFRRTIASLTATVILAIGAATIAPAAFAAPSTSRPTTVKVAHSASLFSIPDAIVNPTVGTLRVEWGVENLTGRQVVRAFIVISDANGVIARVPHLATRGYSAAGVSLPMPNGAIHGDVTVRIVPVK